MMTMTHSAQRERIEMRVDEDIKQLAARASAALGCASLTEFITSLIRDTAPKFFAGRGRDPTHECPVR